MGRTQTKRTHVAMAGLTAAGKTTHARGLANALGYDYVSGSRIIIEEILAAGRPNEAIWKVADEELKKAMTDHQVARELEERLTALLADPRPKIFDTWVLPWMKTDAQLVRVWLESDRLSRTYKCYVSQGEAPTLDIESCARLIDEKDFAVREQFEHQYGVDIFVDRTPFDVVLNNTTTIDSATEASAARGVAKFSPIVEYVVRALLGLPCGTDTDLPQSPRPEFPFSTWRRR